LLIGSDTYTKTLEGLRKAGLEIPGNPPVVEAAVTSAGGSGPMPADQGT